jgi:hypothetical protein
MRRHHHRFVPQIDFLSHRIVLSAAAVAAATNVATVPSIAPDDSNGSSDLTNPGYGDATPDAQGGGSDSVLNGMPDGGNGSQGGSGGGGDGTGDLSNGGILGWFDPGDDSDGTGGADPTSDPMAPQFLGDLEYTEASPVNAVDPFS